MKQEKVKGKVLFYDGYKFTNWFSYDEFVKVKKDRLIGRKIFLGDVIRLVREKEIQVSILELVYLWEDCSPIKESLSLDLRILIDNQEDMKNLSKLIFAVELIVNNLKK